MTGQRHARYIQLIHTAATCAGSKPGTLYCMILLGIAYMGGVDRSRERTGGLTWGGARVVFDISNMSLRRRESWHCQHSHVIHT